MNGDYSTIDNPNDPGNAFFGGSRFQQMFLPALGPDPNSPDTIDVFENGDDAIGALAITPAKTLQKVRISSSSPSRSRCGGREIPHLRRVGLKTRHLERRYSSAMRRLSRR